MPEDNRLDQLLERWEDGVERGERPTVEQLCSDCPELAPELRARIEDLQSISQLLHLSDAPTEMCQDQEKDAPGRRELDEGPLTAEIDLTQPRFHAEGGLGVVFTASDSHLHREVAIKFLHRSFARDSRTRDRFCREAEITSRLDHPGIVPVHGIGETRDGRPFYIMRFIRGETFEAAIQNFRKQQNQVHTRQWNLEFRALLTRFISVCNTIAYAHNRGIVHRDIKPENIMLGSYGETMVVDWGLALPVQRDPQARASGERTLVPRTGNARKQGPDDYAAGTPTYMSPEQASGETSIGIASDIYSLGAVLYKILTGQSPVDGKTLGLNEIRQRIREGRITPPRSVSRKISRSLEAICLRAMARSEHDRYPSALELAADLERYLGDERVQAYRESPVEIPFRWFRKHRLLAQVTAVSILLLVMTLTSFSIWTESAKNELETANTDLALANRELLVSAAKLTALTVAQNINERYHILERESENPDLIARLNDPTPNRGSLLEWLQIRKNRYDATADSESWFICDAHGVQQARIPEEDSIGNSYAHRDYFHGKGLDLKPGENPNQEHITDLHLSVPYTSSNDDDKKVALSIPILGDPSDGTQPEFLGVLGMSIKLGNFQILQQDLATNQVAVLINLGIDQLEGDLEKRGLILHHPNLPVDQRTSLPRIEGDLLTELEKLRETRRQEFRSPDLPRSPGLFRVDYRDPVPGGGGAFSGTWYAAFEPVRVEGREGRARDPGWVVIVQKQAAPRH
ncbi:MAG: protein kinase [Verrucomicrobia bacterium]|nr:protein kinase [Verrucomicrobiota bacterium]